MTEETVLDTAHAAMLADLALHKRIMPPPWQDGVRVPTGRRNQ